MRSAGEGDAEPLTMPLPAPEPLWLGLFGKCFSLLSDHEGAERPKGRLARHGLGRMGHRGAAVNCKPFGVPADPGWVDHAPAY